MISDKPWTKFEKRDDFPKNPQIHKKNKYSAKQQVSKLPHKHSKWEIKQATRGNPQ